MRWWAVWCVARCSWGLVAPPPRSGRRAPLTVVEGIPKMFRWLTDQYPQIMERISEALPEAGDSEDYIDNLYLDMNGIIHQCTHSNDAELVTTSTKEQLVRIFQFTDKLCKLVRPRRLIYLAVDGVAPRAKMNQQRARRFRSSMEREQLLRDVVEAGGSVPEEEAFDSNCITPGTEFMFKLGVAFRAWLEHKCANDPFYSGPDAPLVIFSGPDVAGEGEHKIMEYVRAESAKPGWSLELRHCFYGLDADLIMLSLVTHQPYFRLLREKVFLRKNQSKRQQPRDPLAFSRYDFEILEVALLREMIELQLAQVDPRLDDKERLVDDFVFVCMLVGNDFLPHLPHLDILSGALDLSLNIYRDLLPRLGGFVTDKARVHLPRFELVAAALARFEPDYFDKRGAIENVPEYRDPTAYRAHYYRTKFGFDPDERPERVRDLARDYVLGLFWCAQYYHRGVLSWDWFYPHLYAPLASDLVDLPDLSFEYPSSRSRPFTPLMQLMSVLPPQSARLLPPSYAALMTDATSRLKDAYPFTFDLDPNGKTQPWEAVVLIPFLDEDIMISQLNQIDHLAQLSDQERRRNDVRRVQVWRSRDKPPTPALPRAAADAAGDDEDRDDLAPRANKRRRSRKPRTTPAATDPGPPP